MRVGPMMIATLEKEWMWPRITYMDDILDKCDLVDLAIIGHIQ